MDALTHATLPCQSLQAFNIARHRISAQVEVRPRLCEGDCLHRALESCDRARSALVHGLSQEYVAVDLDQGLRAVGEVIGVVDVEQILDSVFSQFCIGK